MAPIFSIVLGAEYFSYVKFIAIYALTFFGYIISVLASVYGDDPTASNRVRFVKNTFWSLEISAFFFDCLLFLLVLKSDRCWSLKSPTQPKICRILIAWQLPEDCLKTKTIDATSTTKLLFQENKDQPAQFP